MPYDGKTEPMEQLSVCKWKRTNIPSYAPPSDGGMPGSFTGKTRTQYNTRRLMVTIHNRDGGSAAGRWVAALPADKCRQLGYGAVHTRPSQTTPCQAGSSSPLHTRCRTDGRVHSRTSTTTDPADAKPRTPVCLTLFSLSPPLSRFADLSVRWASASMDAGHH